MFRFDPFIAVNDNYCTALDYYWKEQFQNTQQDEDDVASEIGWTERRVSVKMMS